MKHVPHRVAIALLAIALPAFASAQAPAAKDAAVVAAGAAPGRGAAGAAVQKVATVESVDKASRAVVLKTDDGRLTRVVAGPEVRNFDRIAVGDRVVTTYVEAVSLQLRKGGDGIRERAESEQAARAPDGGKPGAVVQHRVRVVADVIAANPRTRVLTLRGPERTVELRVPDAKQFASVKVGDQVEVLFTEALMVNVVPAAPAAR